MCWLQRRLPLPLFPNQRYGPWCLPGCWRRSGGSGGRPDVIANRKILDVVREHLFFALIAPPHGFLRVRVGRIVCAVVEVRGQGEYAAFFHPNWIAEPVCELPV